MTCEYLRCAAPATPVTIVIGDRTGCFCSAWHAIAWLTANAAEFPVPYPDRELADYLRPAIERLQRQFATGA